MNKMVGLIFLTLAVAVLLVAAGCGSSQPAQEVKPIKIGVIYPMSGDLAVIGADQKAAMELAQTIINGEYNLNMPLAKTKGLPNLKNAPIQLIFADSQSKPEVARSEAERLINQEKVVALLGAYASSSTAPSSQVAERYGIPYVTPESTRADLTERGYKWFFRNIPFDRMAVEEQFKFLAELKKQGKDLGNIGIANENSLWGQGSADEQKKLAEKYGFKIAATVAYPKEITDVTSEVLKLKAANVNTLLITAYVNDSILFQKTLKEQNLNLNAVIGLEGGHVAKEFVPALGKSAEFVLTSATWSPGLITSKEIAGKVNAMFKEKYGRDMSAYQPHAFTAVMVLADAINRAGSTEPEAIRKAIVATDYPGDSLIMPWKGVKYDNTGQNIYGNPLFLQILDGKYEVVYPFEIATKKVVWPAPKWSER
jgi:branched-chain amino acid transport system substrate-binding protein